MAAKSIAVAADVSTEPASGSSAPPGFVTGGSWSEASLSVETRSHLTVEGAPVAWKAQATFRYDGNTTATGNPPGSFVTPSPLVLDGSSTALTASGQPLLRDGDTAEDSFGNKIVVSSSALLRSE